MAKVRTVDFLPEIFQTSTNKQFLAATLDQLVQEPKFKKTQGFVGRHTGPGVNADGNYVVEPTKIRRDYQLEPGVVMLKTDSDSVEDAITYPGITDALSTQGSFTNNSNRLYTSEYYTWNPQVDFDKFVNFSQYYWLPNGPLLVDLGATSIPISADYTVTRENGVYTFSNYNTNNPPITLVRGGNYRFNVAQNDKESVNFRVTTTDISAYVIDYVPNPALTLIRGNTYVFNLNLDVTSPFWIKTAPSQGTGDQYNSGVSRNGSQTGNITFTVPQDAPDNLYYTSETQFNMQGTFTIVDGTPGTGPGFWIQMEPGVSGTLSWAPNISSRDVLGVTNNGEDLGTVEFNVPYDTAQSFYYSLPSIGSVDLITNLQFEQINNQFVTEFFAQHPNGIDNITNLDGRTVVFVNNSASSEGGWDITTQFDPLVGTGGGIGSFDSIAFSESTPLTQTQRYSVWKIQYITTTGGQQYIKLNSVLGVNNLEKFNILFGSEYSSTQWYKDSSGVFAQIPLLTAIKDVLYYQDATDPGIFGQIRLINQDLASTIFISDIIDKPSYTSPNGVTFTNGLKITFAGATFPTSYENQEYYVEGVGTAIKLLPVANFVTPELYITDGVPLTSDYITINRASLDLNAWTRSNRWFHIDVINASAEYNNTTPVLDNNQRAQRPVIEFNAGTKLFNFGTDGKQAVNIVDFNATDAFSNINGSIGYSVDGYTLVTGTRIIFANDSDLQARNKIYEVTFIEPDSVNPLIAQPIINLVPAEDSTVLVNQTVVALSGITQQGNSYYFDGVNWLLAQEKTAANQAPLFDVFDSNGISFSNQTTYPSSTFIGSKLFSYAIGTGRADPVLGFPIRYLSLTNIGDIVFDNNLYSDTFNYVIGTSGAVGNVSDGFVYQYSNRITYARKIGWEVAAAPSQMRQQFQFTYDGRALQLDIVVSENSVLPAVLLYIANKFILPTDYTVNRNTKTNTTLITLKKVYTLNDVIEVQVLSNQTSATAFYAVPVNLENNPFNENSSSFTLGTVRTHYESIAENLINFAGSINGPNNTRDLGNISRYGTTILQQSSPLTLSGFFMREPEYNIFKSLEFNDREYNKFKNRMLEAAIQSEWGTFTTTQILDSIITDLGLGKSNINSFFYSDMMPSGSVYTEVIHTVSPITTGIFDTVQTYTFTSANFLGVLVYRNNDLLTLNYDYTVATDGPRIDITTPLVTGDRVTIREYATTTGSFIPNTPTKLGLYAAYKPEIYLDTNYVNPTIVIRGHDGSVTAAFGDLRDDILLEFERRIFNNLKVENNPIPLTADDVMPGYFRSTDYTAAEITNILSKSFLTWIGQNKIDYKTQQYINTNEFTYNYSQAGDKQTNQPLLGAWRGIYKDFYDTLSPATTPWEMLGFSQRPTWWTTRYGPAPYTGDNLVLWDDIQAGYVADPVAPYIIEKYKRPNLSTYFIPTGSEGELLSPLESVVGSYDPNAFRKSWVVGDGGPAEAAWWMSSSYPFAVMRLLALTRPAQFFSLFADRDLYKYDPDLEQYLYNGRYRLDANGIEVYGEHINTSVYRHNSQDVGDATPVSKASYINWIVDYNQQLGINSTQALEEALASLDVRLCWRTSSFTDKQYLKIYTERSSPDSQNSSLLLPDESYNLLLYKNVAFSSVAYSAVIIQVVENGYAVLGYSTTDAYFNILASRANGQLQTISSGGSTVRVPKQYTTDIVTVPYGFVFTSQSAVADFLLSYGQYLTSQGLIFGEDRENGYSLDWLQMANEFLYWANQGWGINSLINLNPAATQLIATLPGAVIDNVLMQNIENIMLDQSRLPFDARNLIIERLENRFSVTSTNTGRAIAYANLRYTSYENLVILDNVSIFNDLIYNPTTAARQNRINVVALTTTEWDGTLNAQGFVLNQDNVQSWAPLRKYAKGEIVNYKNNYWSAQTIIQPKIEFTYSDWVKSDYTKIQKGLLPNIANKADQLANSYNTHTANLEGDTDLLSYGLIGFRPREYMAALNLDDTSQVNLYKQFISTKGTTLSAEVFTGANLGKEVADYQLYENWAIRRGTYGANANRSYFELELNEAVLQSDPATIQVINVGEISVANQTVYLNDLWSESYKLTSPDILPTTTNTITDTALPSAGYVNINDVDITVFSLDDPTAIAANLDNIGEGTRIWVAKTNSYDWNVYRTTQTPGKITRVSDNLDGTSLVTFSTIHNLRRGDLIIVRFFNESFNGVYRVLTTPAPSTLTVAYTFPNNNQTVSTGNGLGFYLDTMRVSQASDVGSLSYANDLVAGALAWVDNNGSGLWEVLEKQDVFIDNYELTQRNRIENTGFGTSIAQAVDNVAALVGAPTYFNETTGTYTGALYSYVRGNNSLYVEDDLLVTTAADTLGFGNSVAFGNQTWAVVGASLSYSGAGYVSVINRDGSSITQSQLLVAPDYNTSAGSFGTSVAISKDERIVYVGAPDENAVYAYGRVNSEIQQLQFIADGVTAQYDYLDSIIIDYTQPEQMRVIVNNSVQVEGTDYIVGDTSVIFTTPPASNLVISLSRRNAIQLDHQFYYSILQDSTSGSGSQASFTIERTRGTYTVSLTAPGLGYAPGDTITINAATIGGGTSPANDLVITVSTVTAGGIVTFTVSGSGVDNEDQFDLAEYLYEATDINSFNIVVNGVEQRLYIDYTFSGTTVTFNLNPAPGATINVATRTYFKYIDKIEGPAGSANFGYNVASATDGRQVVVGAPTTTVSALESGSTYVYDRSVLRYLVGVSETATTTFSLPVGWKAPVSVLINNAFLTNADIFVNGGFSVIGNDVVLSNDITLAVGDVIEIESNIFNQVQQIVITSDWDSLNQTADNTPTREAQFGWAVDMCPQNCSVYTGSPQNVNNDSGAVQRNVNQSRVYGIIASPIANPALNEGDTLRINNYEVIVPASPNNTVSGLASAINSFNNGVGIPNVTASVSDDLYFTANGNIKTFDIGVTYSKYDNYTPVVYANTILQVLNTDYTYNNASGIVTFITTPADGTIIHVVSGILTISIINSAAALAGTKLNVLPGLTGTAFTDIGFVNYTYTQTITSPNPTQYARFGSSLTVDSTGLTLVVGAPNGNMYSPVTFDANTTYFDDRSTVFSTTIIQSGVAYTFDYLPSATDTVTNPGKFVFGQQLFTNTTKELDNYGMGLSYITGTLLVGAPGNDLEDSQFANFGQVVIFDNTARINAWTVKHQQMPVVDVALLNSVYMFNKLESQVTSYLDFFNPLQGKILGVARENIDYIGAVDPANYNNGPIHNVGNPWSAARVGQIWWDTNSVRFIDPNQNDIVYASRRWGQTFPGSRIDIYQWVESSVTPNNYTGPGTPLSYLSYTTRTELGSDNIFVTRYYFWARNVSTVNTAAGKKLSTTAIANYIEYPRASGIAYLAPLDASTVAIYNVLDLISARDTILHIEYDRVVNNDNVHQEYELIAAGREDSFLSDNLYLKLQDSFSGINSVGANVPDIDLSPVMRYGVTFRPRQSMFTDRFSALANYLGRANLVLSRYPISETKSFVLLNSREPEPKQSSGAWNARVANMTELGYQNLILVPIGYKYLVAVDSTNSGFWTLYEVIAGSMPGSKEVVLIRVQNYDTRRYWSYIDWYQPGYNRSVNTVATVSTYSGLSTVTLTTAPVGASVTVTNAPGTGKFEIYQRTDIGWVRVGLESGTIEFSTSLWNYPSGNFGFDLEVFDAQYFDQEPVLETRKIIQAINEQLFVDELLIERNRALILIFEYIMSEFSAPEWLIKTSLIDVDHKIRDLLPYQFYNVDNQDFVLNYIQEVKPYHTQIREFNLSYNGNDLYPGSVADFDLPAYWEPALTVPKFISPVLLPYTQSTANSTTNFDADTAANSTLWAKTPWNEWYANYTLDIQAVIILSSGAGYTVAPIIEVIGNCVEPAEMTAIINGSGQVTGITIDNYGSGYTTTAMIFFIGGNGSGATAAVTMSNDLIRQVITRIKYDRYEYSSDIVEWAPNIEYTSGTQVRYVNRVWEANETIDTATFDPDQWTIVNPALLSGVDRTMGFYTPTANEPGLSLPLLIDGVEYPGVQMFGVGYDQYPGFDIAPYDSTPFDNLTYGPEGKPTYDPSILDAIYESPYNDPYLGTLATSINADGGEYIDTYSSHAPEELIPGSEFDTLDLRVYTTPGSDWTRNGHGFRIEVIKYNAESIPDTFSFAGIEPVPATLLVANQTTGLLMHIGTDYTADWANRTITIINGANIGDAIVISLYQIGGGNQLLKRSYNGDEVGNSLVVPVEYSLIEEFVIFVNGELITNYTYAQDGVNTVVTFSATYTAADYLMIAAIGPTTVDETLINYSWSAPVTQYIAGVTGQYNYTLTNSMAYTNPDNVYVTIEGRRVRTAAGAQYLADGTSEYLLPQRLGFSQAIIADSDVRVYIDDIPQVLYTDFTVEPYDAETPRAVIFNTTPSNGEKILICVTTNTQAIVTGNQLIFNPTGGFVPATGELVALTSWNDTRQQDILTQVYVGPTGGSQTNTETFDEFGFDIGTVTLAPGSFDYSATQAVTINQLLLDHVIVDPDRLIVTLNGNLIFNNVNFTIVNNEIILAGGYILSPADQIIITQFTPSVAPESMAFRIFQDMRGVQATYRITAATTTYLTQALSATDDTIYVYNAAALNQPNLAGNVWGLLTINGERIMYRNRDVGTNTVSGLRRGTGGTGAADHEVSTDVYNISRGNLLLAEYQNYIVSNVTYPLVSGVNLGDGSTTEFVASLIDVSGVDSTADIEAIEVYIGGTLQLSSYTVTEENSVTVVFDTAPADGSEVTILVRRGVTWYAPGVGTPSDGIALQDTNTDAARFLRGY
tara:strand:+ start:8007 stop:22382 length:14376 start_codon:yes stop_codon:yes gene_type:complete